MKTLEQTTWQSVKNRCKKRELPVYKHWIKNPDSFVTYVKKLKNCPKDKGSGLCLTFIEEAKGCVPDNLYWGSKQDSQRKTKRALYVRYKGKNIPLNDFAEIRGATNQEDYDKIRTVYKDCSFKLDSIPAKPKDVSKLMSRDLTVHKKRTGCLVEGCNNKHKSKGYCERHANQIKVYGEVKNNTLLDLNEVEEYDTYYELILTNKKLEETGRVKIDKEDLYKVQQMGRWGLNPAGYAIHGATSTLMHRYLMGIEKHDRREVDHKKRGKKNRIDNRKKNLRVCTRFQNIRNMSINILNTSGFKGVCLNKRTGRWVAAISFEGKRISLGTYKTPEQASIAYETKAIELHGEFYYKYNQEDYNE